MKRLILTLLLVALTVTVLAGCKPYTTSSVWNQTAASKGVVTATAGTTTQFGTTGMILGGGPGGSHAGDHLSAKPIYKAAGGEPCRGVTLREPTWNTGNTEIPANDCIPVPDGLQAAGESADDELDHHLTIVNSELTYAWSFWQATQDSDAGEPLNTANVLADGYEATNGSKWKINGNDSAATGVADCCGDSTGRGSGTELLTNVFRTEEAGNGVAHAMGITVPCANSSGAIWPPATKSDGDCSGSAAKYGSLWVLDNNYTCPAASGPANLCAALKVYGVYVVDQQCGADLPSWCTFSEIDTTGDYGSETAAHWQALGVSRNALPIPASAWRCVNLTVTSANDCN